MGTSRNYNVALGEAMRFKKLPSDQTSDLLVYGLDSQASGDM